MKLLLQFEQLQVVGAKGLDENSVMAKALHKPTATDTELLLKAAGASGLNIAMSVFGG